MIKPSSSLALRLPVEENRNPGLESGNGEGQAETRVVPHKGQTEGVQAQINENDVRFVLIKSIGVLIEADSKNLLQACWVNYLYARPPFSFIAILRERLLFSRFTSENMAFRGRQLDCQGFCCLSYGAGIQNRGVRTESLGAQLPALGARQSHTPCPRHAEGRKRRWQKGQIPTKEVPQPSKLVRHVPEES